MVKCIPDTYSLCLDIFRCQDQLNVWLRCKTPGNALKCILQWLRSSCTSSKYSLLITGVIFMESCKHTCLSSEISCYVKLCIVCIVNQFWENSTANILGFGTAKKMANGLVTPAAAVTLRMLSSRNHLSPTHIEDVKSRQT